MYGLEDPGDQILKTHDKNNKKIEIIRKRQFEKKSQETCQK